MWRFGIGTSGASPRLSQHYPGCSLSSSAGGASVLLPALFVPNLGGFGDCDLAEREHPTLAGASGGYRVVLLAATLPSALWRVCFPDPGLHLSYWLGLMVKRDLFRDRFWWVTICAALSQAVFCGELVYVQVLTPVLLYWLSSVV